MKINYKILLVFLFPLLVGMSCEQRLYHFTAVTKVTKDYDVNEMGSFSISKVITSGDILNSLDIPDEDQVKITDVNIRKLSVRIIPNDGNSGLPIIFSGKIRDQISEEYLWQGSQITPPIVGVNVPFIGLNNVIAAGINKLKGKIKDFLLTNDIFQGQSFFIDVTGNTVPAGNALNLTIRLAVDITVKYDQCIEVPTYIDSGEECNL